MFDFIKKLFKRTNKNFLNYRWWENATPDALVVEIAKGAKVDTMDIERRTPLMFAARWNKNPEVIKTLVELGAAVNARDNEEGTPLMYAARFNNPEVIKTLVDLGAKINAKNKWEQTSLMHAASFNNPEVIKTLVDLGAKINAKDKWGQTPLMFAAKWNENPEVIKTLVELGADIYAKDNEGKTVLNHANKTKNSEIATFLKNKIKELNKNFLNSDWWKTATKNDVKSEISKGADVNAENEECQTPLMYAAENKNPEVIKTLVELGADIYAKDNEGKTALDYANKNKNSEIATFLKNKIKELNKNFLNSDWWETATKNDVKSEISKGADVNAENEEYQTPLMYAVEWNKNPEVIKTLIKANARVDAKDRWGKTSLMYAAENKNPEVIKTLVELGADIYAKDNDGKIALDYANKNKNSGIATFLKKELNKNFLDSDWWKTATKNDVKSEISKGADVNAKNEEYQTPLMYAVEWNKNPEVIKTLIDAGADVNAEDSDRWTPLMCAAEWNKNPEVIKTLIKANARVDAKDRWGKTSLMYAAESNENPEVIKTLAELGAKVNAKDYEERTPLMYAAESNQNPEVIKTLIGLGYELLIKAINNNDIEEVESYALPQYINKPSDFYSFTPLMYAITNKDIDPDILYTLLSEGANIYDKYKVGDIEHTALELAILQKNKNAINEICNFCNITEETLQRLESKLNSSNKNKHQSAKGYGGYKNPYLHTSGSYNTGDQFKKMEDPDD